MKYYAKEFISTQHTIDPETLRQFEYFLSHLGDLGKELKNEISSLMGLNLTNQKLYERILNGSVFNELDVTPETQNPICLTLLSGVRIISDTADHVPFVNIYYHHNCRELDIARRLQVGTERTHYFESMFPQDANVGVLKKYDWMALLVSLIPGTPINAVEQVTNRHSFMRQIL